MSTLVGKPAPHFNIPAVMPDDSFANINLTDFLHKKYTLLFFYPLDFTFVCPTEIIAFNNRISQFEALDTKILGASIDSQYTHLAWKSTPINKGGIGDIQYPLISDINKTLAKDFGVLADDGVALRGTFLIDKTGIVRHESVNDLPIGRNVKEILRIIESLQHYESSGNVCPAGWQTDKESLAANKLSIADYLTTNAENL
ncbi:peroxiredoxin 2/4 [Candidatus Xenohaliotis californiensis]|uniref:Peroxiredoxin 2/4 n=1 Tax=Candidatus Xenohaliotis californiensis TaxID=84677 RepID=A0ABM9N874_9RICK|nr:peroxiredoxin 2/4 [Candidatus Xenohaliotis californiensis]